MHRAPDRHTLSLAAGKLADRAVGIDPDTAEADLLEQRDLSTIAETRGSNVADVDLARDGCRSNAFSAPCTLGYPGLQCGSL